MQKADIQPDTGESPNQVTLDERVIHIDDQQNWPYPAVDPETNEFLRIRLFFDEHDWFD